MVKQDSLTSIIKDFESRTDLLVAFDISGSSLGLIEASDFDNNSIGSSLAQLKSTEHSIGTTKFLKNFN